MDRLRRNLWLKLVSLVLAYLAWTVVVGRPQQIDDFNVNVFFQTAEDAIVVEHSPSAVAATISGDETLFRSGQLDRLVAEVDLRGREPGEHDIYVGRNDIRNLPRGAEVDRIDGPVHVIIEERVARPIGVMVIHSGSLPETHELADLQPSPRQVNVTGPASIVTDLDAARTEPVDLSSRRSSFGREVRIQQIDKLVRFEPDAVRVTATIVERFATGRVELAVAGVPQGWSASPARVSVSVTAARSVLQRALDAARARVTPGELSPGVSVPVEVSFPGLPVDVLSLIERPAATPAAVTLDRAAAPR